MRTFKQKKFAGSVVMYDETFYVDTETGDGLDKILKKIEPLINKIASKTFIPGFAFEDLKQELNVLAINGVKQYDPSKAASLSTFLHIHLKNKVISKLINANKPSRSATIFKDENPEAKFKKANREVYFSEIKINQSDNTGGELFENQIKEHDSFYSTPSANYDYINFASSIEKISKTLDSKTSKILELVCFKDYTIQDAADEVGLSNWAANVRLRKLARKPGFRAVLGK